MQKKITIDKTLVHPDYQHLNQLLDESEFVVFDIETTGGNPEKNGITEICAFIIKDNLVQDEFYSMVNPGRPVPPIVRKLTGIDNQMVKNAPPIQEVMPRFLEFIGNRILVSHNTIGDLTFLRYFARQTAQVKLQNFFLCTHLLADRLLSEAPQKSLTGLAEFLKLSQGLSHRAREDALVTFELFKVLLEKLSQKKIETILRAIRFQEDWESALRLAFCLEDEEINKIPDQVGLLRFTDDNAETIFATSAVRAQRELKKILKFEALPKQLAKVLLKSARIEFVPCPHLFHAMYLEGLTPSSYLPYHWHLRSDSVLYLSRKKEHIAVAFGPLPLGVIKAFGPIKGQRELKDYLGQIKRQLNPIPMHLDRFMEYVLKGQRIRALLSLVKQKLLPGPGHRFAHLLALSKILHPEILRNISFLLNKNGIILAKSKKGPEVDLYIVINGLLQDHFCIKQHVWNWLLTNEKGAAICAQLKKAEKEKAEGWITISKKNAAHYNTVLWSIQRKKSLDVQFISYKKLKKILSDKARRRE